MTQDELLSILKQAGKLKENTRHCWITKDRKESVADHSWRIALMAMLLRDEPAFSGIDMDKVIRMCLIHDLGESFTGDIPAFEKGEKDTDKEDRLFHEWVGNFPEPVRSEWRLLLKEMEEQKTDEAKVYKSLDKLEALISHDESDISTWLPLEYSIQLSYGRENVKCNPYLEKLHDVIDQWTEEKIQKEKKR